MPHFMRKWGCFMQKTVTRRDEEGYTGDGSKSRRPLTRHVGKVAQTPSSASRRLAQQIGRAHRAHAPSTSSARKSPKRAYACLGDFLVHSISTQKRQKTLYIVSLPVGIFFTMQTAMFLTSIRNAKSTLLVALFLLGAVFLTVKKPPLKRSGSNLICRKQQFPFFYARFDDEAYL